MKWPFVSRRAYDLAIDEARKQADKDLLAHHLRESKIAQDREEALIARHRAQFAELDVKLATMAEQRAYAQRLLVSANTRAVAAESRLHAMSERFVSLVEKVATPTPPLTMPERKRDDVAEAIALRAGADVSLRRHLAQWAAQQRRAGVDETTIINSILHWKGDDEDTAA